MRYSHLGRVRGQRGVAALLTAFFMLTAVLCLVLVVDSGRLYYEKRSLQRIADMAALDAATQGGLCGGDGGGNVTSLAQASAVRNKYTGDLSKTPNSVTVGYTSVSSGVRVFTADTSHPEAVEVIATNPVQASLIAGGIIGNQVTLTARAVAQRNVQGSLSIGSGLLRLNSGKSPLLGPILGGLLGTSINTTALSYNGIANANVSLLSFLNAAQVSAGLGSTQDVLNSNIALASVVGVIAQSMAQSADASVVNLGTSLTGSLATIKSAQVNLGQVLGLQAGQALSDAALNTSVNLFDLLMTTAELANKNSAVALNLGVPNVASAKLSVIQPPQIAVGQPGIDPATGKYRTTASTGQLALDLVVNPSVNLGLASTSLDLDVRVNLATGTASLASIACSSLANPTTTVVIHANTSTDNILVGSASNISNPANVTISALGIPVLKADIAYGGSGGTLASGTADLQYQIDRSRDASGAQKNTITPSATQTVTSSVALNIQLQPVNLVVLGASLGPLLNGVLTPILAVVNSTLGPVLSGIVNTLLSTLGIGIGYSDVTLISVNEQYRQSSANGVSQTGGAQLVN